ncbi:MAG: ATP-grasp domain-containing protein, partial [Methanosarcinales archaeon]
YMNILVAEYAVSSENNNLKILHEGRAMLATLVKSFEVCGHKVFYPTHHTELNYGNAIPINKFGKNILFTLKHFSKKCDAGIVIAPDEILANLTKIIEKNTKNLSSPSDVIALCADKLKCSEILRENGIPVPDFNVSGHEKYVIKPRFGCASEDTIISEEFLLKDQYITTEFIEGESVSASIIRGKHSLLLSINKQLIEFKNSEIMYNGGIVPYETARNKEIIDTAIRTANILDCKGYIGIDMVLGDKIYVVDVNPRPTTSIIGINRVINYEIGDLILRAFGFGLQLPQKVEYNGVYKFTKKDLEKLEV